MATSRGSWWESDLPPGPTALVLSGLLSDGVAQFRFRGRVQSAIAGLEAVAVKEGRWPKDLEECRTMGVILDPPPANGVWHLEGKTLRVEWPPTPEGPWSPSAP